MGHSTIRRALLAAFAICFCFNFVDVASARRQPLELGEGETANDAVRRGILAGDRIPTNIQQIRDRLSA